MRVNRLELLKANIGLELISVFDDLDKYFSNNLTGAALTEFERQAGILGLSVPKKGYNSLVESVLNGSYKVEGFASFSDKLWQYQFELKADIEKLLIRSVTGGINPKALAPQLKRLMTEQGKLNATYNAQRLLVSETTRIQTAIQEESYKKADIESYEYIAEPSACPICGALNGKIFKLKDMSPGINAPNMHPFCRCSTAPHVDDKGFWDDLLDRKVISQDEYKQAFDDRVEADKAIEELRNLYRHRVPPAGRCGPRLPGDPAGGSGAGHLRRAQVGSRGLAAAPGRSLPAAGAVRPVRRHPPRGCGAVCRLYPAPSAALPAPDRAGDASPHLPPPHGRRLPLEPDGAVPRSGLLRRDPPRHSQRQGHTRRAPEGSGGGQRAQPGADPHPGGAKFQHLHH